MESNNESLFFSGTPGDAPALLRRLRRAIPEGSAATLEVLSALLEFCELPPRD